MDIVQDDHLLCCRCKENSGANHGFDLVIDFPLFFLHHPILGTGKKNDKHDEPLEFFGATIFLTTSHETGVAGVARCKPNL